MEVKRNSNFCLKFAANDHGVYFHSSLASMNQPPSITEDINLSNSSTISQLQQRLRSSLENIVDVPDDDEEPLVTFPDEGSGRDLQLELR